MVWNVIIDKRTADFKWFKELSYSVNLFANRHKISVNTLKSVKECNKLSSGSLLILLGNNPEWFNEIEENLVSKDVTVVSMIGYISFKEQKTININYDMPSVISKAVEYFAQKGRNKPACFGIMEGDCSDSVKAECFAELKNVSDIYYITDSIENTFNKFYKHINKYDSVLCSNDIVALYLLKKFKEFNIKVPEQIEIIGIGNLWISSHTNPSITTFECDAENMSEVLWRILGKKTDTEILKRVNISLESTLIKRESTNDKFSDVNAEKYDKFYPSLRTEDGIDETICRIRDLDLSFSSFSKIEVDIIDGLSKLETYERIALNNSITVDTVKYHIKKIYHLLGIHTREELIGLISEYCLVLK